MKGEIKEIFIPGEEWVYFKIYCGIHSANTILLNYIAPLARVFIDEGIIYKWFFIRYSDPENHIRLRLLLSNVDDIGKIIIKFKKIVTPLVETNQIWSLEIDTYKRELSRYGKNTMELSESFFFENSEHTIEIIEESNSTEEIFFTTFKYLENLINSFNFSMETMIFFLDKMAKSYKKEFNGLNKMTNKSIGIIYRKLKNNLVDHNFTDKDEFNTLANKIASLIKKEQLGPSIEELLTSFIHMTVNRVFNTNQRMYEMLLYDFLYRKYKSIYARS